MEILILLLIFGISGAVIYTAALNYRNTKYHQFCKDSGLTPSSGPKIYAQYPFRLFDDGDQRSEVNCYEGTLDGARLVICDYKYTIVVQRYNNNTKRYTTSKRNYYQTICIIEDSNLSLPEMFLRRQKSVLDWLGEKFGGQDINLAIDPAFSDAFVLQGSVVDRIKDTFTAKLRKHFVDNPDIFKTFESFDNAFMVNYGCRVPGLSLKDFTGFALEIYNLLKGQTAGDTQ